MRSDFMGKRGLREKSDVFLANCALKIAKLSVNCTCLGPYYEYKKPEALKYLTQKSKV